MRIRNAVVALTVGVTAIAGTAGVALAQEGGSPTPPDTGAKKEFVCTNLADIRMVQADRATLVTDALALTDKARAAAEAAGNTDAVARIDRHRERLTTRQARIVARQDKLATWAGSHCTG